MNKVLNKAKKNIINQKKEYVFLSVMLFIGIVSGILFIFFISKEDKSLVRQELEMFFTNINTNSLNYFSSFMNSFFSNLLYLILIWLLGISIIGIPIIIILLFLKGFVFGFSISSVIKYYGFKGIFLDLAYQFPHQVILLIIYLLMCFYAINFSIKIFKILFKKENINLTQYFKKYNKILGICIIGILLCSILEVFLSPVLIKLFL